MRGRCFFRDATGQIDARAARIRANGSFMLVFSPVRYNVPMQHVSTRWYLR